MKNYLEIDNTGQAKFKVSKTSRTEYLIKEKKYSEALDEINHLIKTDYNSENLNLKGKILDKLQEYEDAVNCFKEASKLNDSDEVKLNTAVTYYNWAKITFFPENDYDKALNLITKAIEVLPDDEDPSEYYFLKAEIYEGMEELVEAQKAYLAAYKEFDKLNELESQINYLKSTDDVLINIVGSDFYNFTPEAGLTVTLIKDNENEHDPDAISVLLEDKLIGYVANSPYTLIEEVKSASDIKNQIDYGKKAEIIFIYLGEYVIAKLLP